jgi:multiple sugar transport system ATP-binding protein
MGVRPENFEDAALVSPENHPHGITFRARVDVVESMGSDNFVYFNLDSDAAVDSAQLEELARDSGAADTGGTVGAQITARLDAASDIKEGTEAELWADSRAIHIFDPASGENLGLTAH